MIFGGGECNSEMAKPGCWLRESKVSCVSPQLCVQQGKCQAPPTTSNIQVIDSVKAQKALACVEELKKIAAYWEEQNTRAFREDTLRMLRKYGFLK